MGFAEEGPWALWPTNVLTLKSMKLPFTSCRMSHVSFTLFLECSPMKVTCEQEYIYQDPKVLLLQEFYIIIGVLIVRDL
jgi:hypothetical protein